jgi:hypothetical protein
MFLTPLRVCGQYEMTSVSCSNANTRSEFSLARCPRASNNAVATLAFIVLEVPWTSH